MLWRSWLNVGIMISQYSEGLPLGLLTESILGPLPVQTWRKASSMPIRATRFSIGLENWFRLTTLLTYQDISFLRPGGIFSVAQWNSYRHLWQWWTAAYQNKAYTLNRIDQIFFESRDGQDFNSDRVERPF